MEGSADPWRRQWAAALSVAMLLPLGAALIYFVWLGSSPLARVVYGATKVFLLLWPLWVVGFWLRDSPDGGWSRPRGRWEHLRALPLGVLSGAGVILLLELVMRTPVGDLAAAQADRVRAKVEDLGILERYWLFGTFLAVMHSGLEEYYWRWFVFGKLHRRLPGWPAHVLGALAFAAHHFVVTIQFFGLPLGILLGIGVGLGGLWWSWMYARQGTLAGAWLSHALIDFGILAVGYRLIQGTGGG